MHLSSLLRKDAIVVLLSFYLRLVPNQIHKVGLIKRLFISPLERVVSISSGFYSELVLAEAYARQYMGFHTT